MTNSKSRAGFTLIELLVVIAIIAVLSAVVLVTISSARNRGADASVKTNLDTARKNSFQFQDAQGSYDTVCTSSATFAIGPNVQAAEMAYRNAATNYDDSVFSTWRKAQCHDNAASWVAWVPLRDSTSAAPLAWCVDSAGNARVSNAILDVNVMTCP